jgi:hypothetical protein
VKLRRQGATDPVEEGGALGFKRLASRRMSLASDDHR